MIKIVQPLNNNVVMGYEKKRGEIVVVGTGIGFHAKKGDVIDESRIQKVFTTENNEKLMELIGQIPPEYLELVEDIFLYAEKEFGILQEDQETLALVDHIHFAVKRLKEGMQLDNPFEVEVR
ncbi:MAG: PRD domain-containing protein, partial [Lachnospiraceae bacterium]|nr:PRD domain-containing protein [Lachnospiraceae bacterium]